ncbi:PCDA1 protein, partial [Amazona guildingii]|nr:PCDA1 protein [Amazona guildingii]
IAESSLPGSRFPLEGASDADVGANAQLSYSLSPSEHFALDLQRSEEYRESLFLVLRKPLDRETMPIHHLVLTATDGGRPPLMGTVELMISVLDANDNAPQFNQSVYKVQLLENTTEGTLVARVNATDPDEVSNAEVTFTASNTFPEKGLNLFLLNPKTGEIRLTGALDFEDVRSYEIQIEATDHGTPPLSGHCKVVVEVLDVNDNPPEVWVTSLSVPVPEDAAVGTVVALLSVSARDSGANGRVRCTVWPEHFALDLQKNEEEGESLFLVLRKPLDRETMPIHRLVLTATDGGRPVLTGTMELVILVLDANDNAPQFNQSVYKAQLPENSERGTIVYRVTATDLDEGTNRNVSYS